jgi:hypothetical protein
MDLMHPPIFFLNHQKENAPCTVEKKNMYAPTLTRKGSGLEHTKAAG